AALPPDEGDTYAWCRPGHGLLVQNSSHITISGVDAWLWPDQSTGQGYGIRMHSVSDSVIEDALVIDCGYHCVGFVNRVSEHNVFRRVTAGGSSPSSGTPFVFYGNAGDVSAVAEDCEIRCYTYLDTTGAPAGGDTLVGFYMHT